MKNWTGWILSTALMVGAAGPMADVARAQYDRHRDQNSSRHGNFDQGYRQQHAYNDRDDRDYERRHQGGIGPGKGALIGGAGGAALGAIFGGGLKGALIGGGVGAGGGAIVGKVHQDNQRNRDYRDGGYGRRY